MSVSVTDQPSAKHAYLERVSRFERDVNHYEKELRKIQRQEVQLGWAVEDAVARAITLFDALLRCDSGYRNFIFDHPDAYEPEVADKIKSLAGSWLSASRELLGYGMWCTSQFGQDSMKRLQSQVQEMECLLEEDEVSFNQPAFVELRDRAMDDHQAGKTDPLLPL